MKKTILVAGSYILMTSCNSNVELQTYQQPKDTHKIIVAHANDITVSTNALNYFDSTSASNLVHTVANGNGGEIKFLQVQAYSEKQNVTTIHIDGYPDTASTDVANMYKKARIRQSNLSIIDQFNNKLQEQVSYYISFAVKPHTEPYTDLTNALALASTTLNQPIYGKGYNKYLLLCSDCINDPKGKRHAKLVPVNIPQTTVLVVRPSLSQEALNDLFPMSKVYVFTDVNDAIAMIK